MNPNVELVQRLYGAFMTGDNETLAASFSPDIVWHNSGFGPTAGDHCGVPAVLEYLGADDPMDDYGLDVVDVLASETRVAVVARASGRRGDTKFSNDFVQLIEINDCVVTEVWNYNWDQRALADFLADAI